MTGITRSASWELKMDTDSGGSDYKATRVTDCMPKNTSTKIIAMSDILYISIQISATSRFTGYSSSDFGATPFEDTTFKTAQ